MMSAFNTSLDLMRRQCAHVFLLVALLVSHFAVAQQAPEGEQAPQSGEPTTTTNQAPEAEQEAKTGTNSTDNNTAGNKKTTGTVFNPTEEISEDSPVPFPVDI